MRPAWRQGAWSFPSARGLWAEGAHERSKLQKYRHWDRMLAAWPPTPPAWTTSGSHSLMQPGTAEAGREGGRGSELLIPSAKGQLWGTWESTEAKPVYEMPPRVQTGPARSIPALGTVSPRGLILPGTEAGRRMEERRG